MPFFYSTSLTTVEKRKEKFDALTQYRYCLCKDGKSLGLHLPLTMDEYCNPSLGSKILDKRNEDQVVHRYLDKKAKALHGPVESRSVITVPQAWIWEINDAVLTSLPSSISPNDLIFESMKNSWFLLNKGRETKEGSSDNELVIGMFLSDLVDVLDRPSMAGLSEPVFAIFEKAISNLSEDVNKYTTDTRVESIDIDKERGFLHIIDDIREELSMISTILFQQEEVWKDFANKMWPQYWPDGPDGRFQPPETPKVKDGMYGINPEIWSKIQRPQIQLAKFKRRISKLDADAERVTRAIDRQLDLKTTHASIKEAHSTAIMSAAVFGFTIVTIIFTPLSFIISLFALPIDRFQKDQVPSVWDDQAGMYSTNYVGKWIGEFIK
jgi:tetrahydromethanopterin S-methyltransferase subunit B